jgi:benzoyl-CoA reductase/2-hydroxyglutaryl-CoA dehydratase subunit BcrC/BadD/HgdB
VAELVLGNELDDSTVVVNVVGSCDSLQNMNSVLAALRPRLRTSVFSLPIDRRGGSAPAFVRAQLIRWADELASVLGKPKMTQDDLAESLETWEAVRDGLLRLEALSAEGRMRRSSYLAVARASLMAPPEETLAWIDEARAAAENRPSLDEADEDEDEEETVRLSLVAGPLDFLGILSDMEDIGAHFVWDDGCAGTTLVAARAVGPGSPIERLAHRVGTAFICPVVFGSGPVRHRTLVEKMSSRGARGALFLIWKFCDPHAFDNALLKRKFDAQSIPYLELEVDPVMSGRGQILTRCQAFIESLSEVEA